MRLVRVSGGQGKVHENFLAYMKHTFNRTFFPLKYYPSGEKEVDFFTRLPYYTNGKI